MYNMYVQYVHINAILILVSLFQELEKVPFISSNEMKFSQTIVPYKYILLFEINWMDSKGTIFFSRSIEDTPI